MSSRLYSNIPQRRPIQDPTGAANGLKRYTGLRGWLPEAELGELTIIEDFRNPFHCTSTGTGAVNATTMAPWRCAHTSAGTGQSTMELVANTAAGQMSLVTAANENDGLLIKYMGDVIDPTKPWSFEAEIIQADITKSDVSIGCSIDQTATTGFAVAGASDDAICFTRIGTGNWLAYTSSDGNDTATDTGVAPVNSTAQTLGIDYNGSDTVKFYVDGALVATNTTNITDEAMRPMLGFNAGTAAVATGYVNYMAWHQSA